MPGPTRSAPHRILNELQETLDYALTILRQRHDASSLSFTTLDSSEEAHQRSFQVDDSQGLSVQLHCAVTELGTADYEVELRFAPGPTTRFSYPASSGDSDASNEPLPLKQQVSDFLLEELDRQFGSVSSEGAASFESAPHVPRLRLGRDGTVRDLNDAACRVLEFASEDDTASSFFSYVHGRNLRRVMWDLAQMVEQGVRRSKWLLRLRTGNNRWRWYRAAAKNKLQSEGTILVLLRPL